jgi:Family of unknown function (DUF6527)
VRRLCDIRHEFVDTIPEHLDDGVVYVSTRYATVVHRCCCGCGAETVTPLSPRDWSLNFDGESISLRPSIGNWSFPCQSHYWIHNNRIRWVRRFDQHEIDAVRRTEVAMAAGRGTPPHRGHRLAGFVRRWRRSG